MFTLEVIMNPLDDRRTLVLRLEGREKGRELLASGNPCPTPRSAHPCSWGRVSPFGCSDKGGREHGLVNLPHPGRCGGEKDKGRKKKLEGKKKKRE